MKKYLMKLFGKEQTSLNSSNSIYDEIRNSLFEIRELSEKWYQDLKNQNTKEDNRNEENL